MDQGHPIDNRTMKSCCVVSKQNEVSTILVSVESTGPWLNAGTCPVFVSHVVLEIEETINIRTPAIIGRSYTETKPRRYSVMPRKGRRSPPYPATEKWSSSVNFRLR